MEGKAKKILFYDPSESTHEVLLNFVIGQNYIAKTECVPQKAMDWVMLYRADLVVIFNLDSDQTGHQACDFCTKLRRDPKTSTIPVVFVTKRNQVGDIVQGFDVGADAFFVQPFDTETFLPRIRQLLDEADSRAIGLRATAGVAAPSTQDLELIFNEVIWKEVEPVLGTPTLCLMVERTKKKISSPLIQAIATTEHGLDLTPARAMAADDEAKKTELKQSFLKFTTEALIFLSKLTGNILIEKIQKEMLKRLN